MTAVVSALRDVGVSVRDSHPASAHLLYSLALALAALGVGVATYLTVVHYAHQPIACNGIGDCEYVNSSEYAKVAGVPVALMGVVSYAALAALIATAWLRDSVTMLIVAWMLALASFAFSMYLTWIELEVLEAICIYCVVSAITMTALFATLTAIAWTKRDQLLE